MLTSVVKQIPGFITGLGKGVVKGAANMAVGAGEMVRKIPGVTAGVDALYGEPGYPIARSVKPTRNSSRTGLANTSANLVPTLPPLPWPPGNQSRP
jgi:hypothetical protein